MDIGISIAPRFLPARPQPLAEVYREYIDDVVYAESLGFDFVYTTEHHFAPDGWSPSQFTILAYLASATERMALGTSVFLMPFHNPLRVAEDLATVDILSNGRFSLFAAGSGSVEDEFQTYGIKSSERWGRLFESLGIIRRCFAEERFDHEGRYFTFSNVRMTTKPVLDPFPLYVGGFGPKLVERAGREGYHFQLLRPDHVELYLKGLREGGHDPAEFNYRSGMGGHIHLAPNHEQAWDEAEEGFHHWQAFYRGREWIAFPNQEIPELPPIGEFRNAENFGTDALVGTPEEVHTKLELRLKNKGYTSVAFGFRRAGLATPLVRRSMDPFGEHILPDLRSWGPATPPPSRRSAA
jgi:alkanesulfonate monooxygenase SsuD/methylene tetrahydromethanopterin reductase-like flavin-dependent oxidoreductase (luciferase family)